VELLHATAPAPAVEAPPDDGPWQVRHGLNGRAPDPARVPICILTCYRHDLAKEAVESVLEHTEHPYAVYVVDNSPDGDMDAWLAQHAPEATYVRRRDGGNVGCVVPRAWFLKEAQRLGARYAVFMDQDVRVTADGWLADMVRTADAHERTGMVAWPLANDPKVFHGGPKLVHVPDETGVVLEVPGLCCLHNLEAVEDTARKVAHPYFREDIFMWGFDTLACLLLDKAGWKTRLVQGNDKIAHEHPHSGVDMNPEKAKHRAYSRKVCRRVIFDLGLKEVPGWL
jgi:GT2 family glycosyltransferase